jgi:REP element-mobilizing transposase RayT
MQMEELKKMGMKLDPPTRAWITSSVHELLPRLLHGVLGQIDGSIQQLGQVMNALSGRLETLILAIDRKGLITEAEIIAARNDFTVMRDQLHLLMSLQPQERFQQLLQWNKKDEVIAIRPQDVMLHEWLAARESDLTFEQRISYATQMNFGEQFIQVLRDKFERKPVKTDGTKDSVAAEEVAETVELGPKLVVV